MVGPQPVPGLFGSSAQNDDLKSPDQAGVVGLDVILCSAVVINLGLVVLRIV